MALFESYERRIDKINEVLNSYGILGLHYRRGDRDQERLYKSGRRSGSDRRRSSGFLYPGICC